MNDQLAGSVLLVSTGLVFVYYTVWVIVLPFVEDEQITIHNLFPDRQLAVALPLLLGLIGLISIGCFVVTVLMKSPGKEKKS